MSEHTHQQVATRESDHRGGMRAILNEVLSESGLPIQTLIRSSCSDHQVRVTRNKLYVFFSDGKKTCLFAYRATLTMLSKL